MVNRGVAAWQGKIFVGAFDGRLVALDARTGKPVWSVMTVDPAKPYTITQAPRVIKGRVVIGNSGGEYGVRGYISAYDAQTGKLAWRFYTVPGDPAKPAESPILAEAAKTWHGEWWKKEEEVRSGTACPMILNLISSISALAMDLRGARDIAVQSQGDNWFLSSIVAIDADTGNYVWHYQVTPGEEWDFDAVQQLILADLTIAGAAASGNHAGQQERILLRPRPQDRKVHFCQQLHSGDLGERHRSEDRPADRESWNPL